MPGLDDMGDFVHTILVASLMLVGAAVVIFWRR